LDAQSPTKTIDGRAAIQPLLARLMTARARLDIDELNQLLAPDVSLWVIGDPRTIYPLPNRHDGREAVLAFIRRVHAMFEYLDSEVLDTIIEGDRGLLFRRQRPVNRGAGASHVVHVMDIFRFRDGKVVEIIQLNDTAALARVIGEV
jgi:ketosteroid isomerase-like protein